MNCVDIIFSQRENTMATNKSYECESFFFTSDRKYIKNYLEGEFPLADINKIMQLVEYTYPAQSYTDTITICVDQKTDEVISGDEDLMDYIQKVLLIMDGDGKLVTDYCPSNLDGEVHYYKDNGEFQS